MELKRVRQNKSNYFNTMCPLLLFGNYRLSELLFSIVFILWLASFANQHTKSTEKHKLPRFIAPKRVKIDTPCKNKKCLNLGAFFRYQCQFLTKVSYFWVCLQTVNSTIRPLSNYDVISDFDLVATTKYATNL